MTKLSQKRYFVKYKWFHVTFLHPSPYWLVSILKLVYILEILGDFYAGLFCTQLTLYTRTPSYWSNTRAWFLFFPSYWSTQMHKNQGNFQFKKSAFKLQLSRILIVTRLYNCIKVSTLHFCSYFLLGGGVN